MKRSATRLVVLVAVLVSVFSAAVYRAGFATPSVGISLQATSAR